MSEKTLNLSPRLYEYFLNNSLREPEVLRLLRERTHTLTMHQMQISPEQGQLMRLLIELMQAKKTLDIGTFTGYSALTVALALPENGKVVACDINEEWTGIANEFWRKAGVVDKMDLRIAPAVQTLDELLQTEKGTFDFVFIDADKANYSAYYEKSLELLRPGGLIAIDNVLWDGAVADPSDSSASTQAIREVNQLVHQDNRVTMCMIPIGDGLTLVRKK